MRGDPGSSVGDGGAAFGVVGCDDGGDDDREAAVDGFGCGGDGDCVGADVEAGPVKTEGGGVALGGKAEGGGEGEMGGDEN